MVDPSLLDLQMMGRALELAAKGLYTTKPNPRVGCVIVRDTKIVAEGWHREAGKAHAEIEALDVAGDWNGIGTVEMQRPPSYPSRLSPENSGLEAAAFR